MNRDTAAQGWPEGEGGDTAARGWPESGAGERRRPAAGAAYQTAVFDMDGVLLRSNGLKSEAFRAATLEYGADAADAMVRLHQRAGSISRRDRVRRFFGEVLGLPEAAESEIERVLLSVGNALSRGYQSAPVVQGVGAYIDRLLGARIGRVVVTGVEQAEARGILEHRGMRSRMAVYGGPPEKRERIEQLVRSEVITRPAVYFGDTLDDYRCAHANGLDFVLVTCDAEWDWEPWARSGPDRLTGVIEHFGQLETTGDPFVWPGLAVPA